MVPDSHRRGKIEFRLTGMNRPETAELTVAERQLVLVSCVIKISRSEGVVWVKTPIKPYTSIYIYVFCIYIYIHIYICVYICSHIQGIYIYVQIYDHYVQPHTYTYIYIYT